MASISKKIVAVGDADCGKTTLLIAFSTDNVPNTDTPQTYLRELINVDVMGKKIALILYNTTGEKSGRLTMLILVMYEVMCASLYFIFRLGGTL